MRVEVEGKVGREAFWVMPSRALKGGTMGVKYEKNSNYDKETNVNGKEEDDE